MTPQNPLFPVFLNIDRPPHGARSARHSTRRRWSPTEEIGWSRTQEIRWSPSQEIGWVRSEEILQTPEHLFAAGYAACFGGAIDYVATQQKKNAKNATVTCSVSIGPRDKGGFGLAVRLHVKDSSLPQAELSALAQEAHEKICPYSHATRGNVPVELAVEGA